MQAMETRSSERAALRASALVRTYRVGWLRKRRRGLAGLDLELGQGASHALVGPNGSGKSTLLRLAAGVERADAGMLEILGKPPGAGDGARRVTWLPSESPFPGELDAAEVLELIASVRGLQGWRSEASDLLELVDLASAGKAPTRTFSRGMLRRLGLAQAFLGAPELVLLDEPTAGLDAPGFTVLDTLLQRAREQGTTVLLASHLLEDVIERCDTLSVLLDGRCCLHGEPRVLLEDAPGLAAHGLTEADWQALRSEAERRGGTLVPGAVRSTLGMGELYRRAAGQERG
jgi:ABC-2 type transport system ATP-binding protein